jgi:hypothetical protein
MGKLEREKILEKGEEVLEERIYVRYTDSEYATSEEKSEGTYTLLAEKALKHGRLGNYTRLLKRIEDKQKGIKRKPKPKLKQKLNSSSESDAISTSSEPEPENNKEVK